MDGADWYTSALEKVGHHNLSSLELSFRFQLLLSPSLLWPIGRAHDSSSPFSLLQQQGGGQPTGCRASQQVQLRLCASINHARHNISQRADKRRCGSCLQKGATTVQARMEYTKSNRARRSMSEGHPLCCRVYPFPWTIAASRIHGSERPRHLGTLFAAGYQWPSEEETPLSGQQLATADGEEYRSRPALALHDASPLTMTLPSWMDSSRRGVRLSFHPSGRTLPQLCRAHKLRRTCCE